MVAPNPVEIVLTSADAHRLAMLLEQQDTSARELLELELSRATIVEPAMVPPDLVTMNSEVTYEDLETSTKRTVRLVYPRDADAKQGFVSVLAPIGSALLGLRVGDVIEWPMPRGQRRVRVTAVRYQPEAAGNFHL